MKRIIVEMHSKTHVSRRIRNKVVTIKDRLRTRKENNKKICYELRNNLFQK